MGNIQEKFGMGQEDQKTKSVDRLVIPICLVLPDSIVEQVALNEDQIFDCVANIFLNISSIYLHRKTYQCDVSFRILPHSV